MSIFESAVVSWRDIGAEVLFEQGDVCVISARLDLDADKVAALAAWLSPDELARARRCHFERDQRRFIVARSRLRELLGERLGVSPDAVQFASGEYGKPMLADGAHHGWQFNLSRSGDLALYALSASRRVGVDVEVVREVRGADMIAENWFSQRERAAYEALDPQQRTIGFLNCWTRKEAFVKALGSGMSFPFHRFDVSLAPGEPCALLAVDGRSGDESGWRMDAFAPLGFVAALVSECRPNSSFL